MTFSWFTLVYYAYWAVLIYVAIQIINQYTVSSSASAWLAAVFVLPVIGLFFYFVFGVKRRKRKMYKQKLSADQKALEHYQSKFKEESLEVMEQQRAKLKQFHGLSKMIYKDGCSRLTVKNRLLLLENGEKKFPQLMHDLKQAKDTIHIEYYTFKFDSVGSELLRVLLEKAKEGLTIRFVYDDYGSMGISQQVLKKMQRHGIETSPFAALNLMAFSDRLNYRNHRKIVVIDGKIGYVGGINVADDYRNDNELGGMQRFWRDTHIRIEGQSVAYLQNIFLNDWNFCSEQDVEIEEELASDFDDWGDDDYKMMQVVASGPDSPQPSILFSVIHAIHLATEELLITTPYFIPDPALNKALKIAALRGVDVRILVPETSDSKVVDAAAQSYYQELLEVGVKIYKYTKGFVHAKTMVVDGFLSVVGTANFDERSFELNFEVNVMVYDEEFASQLIDSFKQDIESSERINPEYWEKRGIVKSFMEKLARMFSPIL